MLSGYLTRRKDSFPLLIIILYLFSENDKKQHSHINYSIFRKLASSFAMIACPSSLGCRPSGMSLSQQTG